MSESNSVVIYFCRTCGFGEPAQQIADVLRETFELSVECRPSFWGCFRIELNGRELFNRWKTRGWLGRLGFGRTPTTDEVIELVMADRGVVRAQDGPASVSG